MLELMMAPVATNADTLRTKVTWMAGDFGKIAKAYERGAAEFIKRLNVGPGARVLDVACGTGNLAIPAARTGARVRGNYGPYGTTRVDSTFLEVRAVRK